MHSSVVLLPSLHAVLATYIKAINQHGVSIMQIKDASQLNYFELRRQASALRADAMHSGFKFAIQSLRNLGISAASKSESNPMPIIGRAVKN